MDFRFLVLCCLAVGIQTVNSKLITRLTNNNVVTSPTQYPYQISLQFDGRHLCGGSIIGKKHVLTAAHCTYSFVVNRVDKSRIKVVVGTTNTAGGTKMDVDRIAVHGNYRHSDTQPTLVADVSVIRLKKEITESESVKIIGLPAQGEELPVGTQLIVTGFGASQINGPTSPVLKHMYEKVVSQQQCQQAWANGLTIGPGHLCASLAPGYGTCQGDSGGPLVKENKQVIVGIVSAGSGAGCGLGIPDLFTKVSYYIPFIRSEMERTEGSQDPQETQEPQAGQLQPGQFPGFPNGWLVVNPGGWISINPAGILWQ